MKHEEDDLQIATATLLRRIALPGVIFFHTPNSGKRSKREAGRFKAMGVLAGVADWTIIWSNADALIPSILFVELKSATGRASDEQKAFRAKAEATGCAYEIARTMDEFMAIISRHGVPVLRATIAA